MSAGELLQLVRAIELDDMTTYLGANGWTRDEAFTRTDVLRFLGPKADDGESLEIVLPAAQTAADFLDRVRDALVTVAALEDRSPETVAREVRRPGLDHLSVRFEGKQAEDGTLPLHVASDLIRRTHQLIVAVAAAEERPVPAYGRATRLAVQHAESCRFGQTSLGSFVLHVECPTQATGQQSTFAPFPRRVTTRLMRGLKRVGAAVLSGSPAAIADGHRDGLNANICEALVELHRAAPELSVGFSVGFSHGVPAEPDLVGEVVLRERAFELLEGAAIKMRGTAALDEREIEGKIVRLAASDVDDDDDDPPDGERTATLRFVDNGRQQNALLQLEPDDYRDACDAHRDGKRVLVTGTLERFGRKWRVVGIKKFAVLAP